jgi:RNA polymerase sigma factor (sigma-70 family)
MAEPVAKRSDFGGFYERTIAPLRRYLLRMIGNTSEAQDLAHDAYAKVFRAMEGRELGHPQAFLYATARNLALDQLKRRGRSPFDPQAAPEDATTPSGAPGVTSVVMAREEWALLGEAMAKLPPGCRQVLQLRMVEHLSHDEICQRLGLARSSVEKHLMRAVRLLHEAMQHAQGAPSAIVTINDRTGSAGR